MGEGSSFVVWFAAPGFVQIGVRHEDGGLVIEVETTAARVGCWSCGVIAKLNAGHGLPFEQPEALERSVASFLSALS